LEPRHPWRGRFTLLPVLTLQDRVVGVCQQSEANISGCWLFVFYFSHREFRITISDIEWINRCL
ncbi:hypothetical protein, partial [Yersinia enterocolitica]|uniref:hypothetical protein n=1 Tax=Yersinia enterocolitica TaxID=630 RepID=UPI001E44AE32